MRFLPLLVTLLPFFAGACARAPAVLGQPPPAGPPATARAAAQMPPGSRVVLSGEMVEK